MRRRFLLTIYAFCGMFVWLIMGSAPQAAGAERPAYIRPVVEVPLWSHDPLSVRLVPDEALCRKKYGKNWRELCAVAPGQPAALVEGVRMTPPQPGQWRWEDAATLRFSPSRAWPAATAYSVDLSQVPLPSRAKLSTAVARVAARPLGAHAAKGQLWIDPDVKGMRAVSFDLRFTAAADKDSVRRALTVSPTDKGMRLAPPELVWNEDGTACLVNVRLLELPPASAALTLSLPGVESWGRDEGGQWRVLSKTEVRQSLVAPGTAGLFQIRKAELRRVTGRSLTPEYELTLESSLLVRPDEVLSSLVVVELPERQNPEALHPYAWDRAPRLGEEDIARGKPLRPEALQATDAPASVLRFRIPAQAGRYVLCYLPAGFGPGVASVKGNAPRSALRTPWRAVYQASTGAASVGFLQPGNVLSLGGEPRLDIYGNGLKAVKWRVERILRPHLGKLGQEQELFYRADYRDATAMSTAREGEISLASAAGKTPETQFASLDLGALAAEGRGLLRVTLTGVPAAADPAVERPEVSRMVLLTGMGLVAKRAADGGLAVFACALADGAPVEGALAQVLGTNGLPVAEARTDAQGRADFPSLSGLTREKMPSAVLVTRDGADAAAGKTSDTGNAAREYKGAAAKNAADGNATARADMAWLALEDRARAVDYSRFPTQGQVSAGDGVNAYVFAQRGIFRPGETLHFGALVRRGDWKPLPSDMPLTATLHDPADRVVLRQRVQPGPEGLSTLEWASDEASPTGRYRLYIAQGDMVLGSGAVRLEEFQPDTLAVRAQVEPQPASGWLYLPEGAAPAAGGASSVAASEPGVRVTLNNLYGMPATDRRVRGQLSVQPAELRFAGYEEYRFHDARPYAGQPVTRDLPEARTDAQGQAVLPLELGRFRGGTMRASVLVEGFEPGGGRAVTTERSFLVSPLRVILGYRPSGPGTNLDFVPQGQRTALEFVALSPALERVNPGALTLTVAERRYVTSLVTDRDGRYAYDETPLEHDISTAHVAPAPDGSLRWDVPTSRPGEYLLTVRDAEKQVMARVPFTVAGNDDLRPATADALPSSVLRLRLDRGDGTARADDSGYAPGDTVRMMLSAPYDGVALITLERDRVAAHRWVRVKAGNSVHDLSIPKDFEGRGYVNVSLARAQASADIFMQPHSYALAPLTVNVARRDMGLRVTAPKLTLPGERIVARIKAKTPGRVVLFAVDEGVLQLTRFTTPDPLGYLLLDRALEVDTRQMFDLLMPDHSLLARRIPAFGGGADLSGGRFHNPFKRRGEPPLAWWSAPVAVGPEGVEVSIPVPAYYSGTVRVMAVGASETTAGRAEAEAVVRGPVTLTPQLPQLAAPGDVFEAALAVANNGEGPLKLRLRVDADAALRLTQTLPDSVDVPAGGERVLTFRVQAGEEPGNAALRFTAADEHGGETTRSAALSLRPASAAREQMVVGSVESGGMKGRKGKAEPSVNTGGGGTQGTVRLQAGRDLLLFGATGSASVSAMPLPALRGLLRYLQAYPYGCVEQRISRAFPLALLSRWPQVAASLLGETPQAREESRRTADAAVGAIQAGLRFGGMALWPDAPVNDAPVNDAPVDDAEGVAGRTSLLLAAYAGDYLLLLHESGLSTPGDVEDRLSGLLEEAVNGAPEDMTSARVHAYALWVLTRAGRITAPQLERLAARCQELDKGWRSDVTGLLMAGSYAIMRMDAEAAPLVRAFRLPGAEFTPAGPLDALAAQSLAVAVLARHFPERLHDMAEDLTARLMEACNAGAYATFTAAQGARALLALAESTSGNREADASHALTGVRLRCVAMQPGFAPLPHAEAAVQADSAVPLLTLDAPGCAVVEASLPPQHPRLYYELSTYGFDRRPPMQARAVGMDVERQYLDADGQPVTTVKLGDVVRVVLTARAHGVTPLDVAISDVLPGGFEMLLEELRSPGQTRMERREDRMLVFTALGNEPVTVEYRMRAVNRGAYTLPPVQGEGMYDRTVRCATEGGHIVVE